MRVIAGALKGQRLTTPKGRTTRPTADQVRIACLDTLMPYLELGPFLDLFAGAGGVGIEALSRGAPSAVFVERERQAVAALEDNIGRLGLAGRARVLRQDVARALDALARSALRLARRGTRGRARRARRLPHARRRRRGPASDQGAAAGRAGIAPAVEDAPIRRDHLDFLSARRVK